MLAPASISKEFLGQDCQRCPLAQSRTKIVWYKGNPDAKLMVIGEGPGEKEDLKGIPFVGRSGELLDKAFVEAGIYPQDVYVTNIVKCRPPNNRNPTKIEMDTCFEFLCMQYTKIKPNLIVVLGKIAAEYLLERPVKITKEHGNLDFLDDENNTPVLIVYHPAYVLRNRKPEIEKSFIQAIQYAKELTYAIPNHTIYKESIG